MHVLVTRLTKRAANTREKPPNALRLTFSTAGQPHDAAGRRRSPNMISPRMGSLPHRKPPQRNPTTCGRPSASSARRPRAQPLVRTTWEAVATIAIASPSPRAELNLYQQETPRPPASLRLALVS